MTGTSLLNRNEETALAAMQEVVGADGAVKRDFLVLPYGNPFYGRDGRGPWIMRDRQQAERVLAATRQTLGGIDMMIDYDHASELAAPEGKGRALAAGWVRDLQIRDDGIWASVDWTSQAETELASRQYRYISPYFRVHKDTREVTRLVNAGLTNTPNLDLPALAAMAGASSGEDPTMTMIALAPLVAALALASSAGETEVLAAIGKLKADHDGSEAALNAARTTLGLAADAGTDAVLAAVQSAKAAKPDPAQYVPKAGFDEVQTRLARLEEERVLNAIDAAVEQGKLAPSMKSWAVELGKKDEAALNTYLASAVPIVGGAPLPGGNPPAREKGKLTEEEKAVCSLMGISHAEFLKNRDEEAA